MAQADLRSSRITGDDERFLSRIVYDRMQAMETWEQFAVRIDDILDPDAPILMQYYSGNRLFSDEARLQFVEPDRRELPPFKVF